MTAKTIDPATAAPFHASQAALFNEWLRRFIDEPSRYEREFETVSKYLAEQNDGREPSYGESCVAYLNQIAGELA